MIREMVGVVRVEVGSLLWMAFGFERERLGHWVHLLKGSGEEEEDARLSTEDGAYFLARGSSAAANERARHSSER